MLTLAVAASAADKPFEVSKPAAQLDQQLDWSKARLIAVQDAGRIKTLESFARETMHDMYGKEHLPGLSPIASVLDWLFRHDAYLDVPVVKIGAKGLRIDLTTHMDEARRHRIISTGYMTPRELADPVVQQRLEALETRNVMARAVSKVRRAQSVALMLERRFAIVPVPGRSVEDPWLTPRRLLANAPDEVLRGAGVSRGHILQTVGPPVPGITPQQALAVLKPWSQLRAAWLAGDAATVQASLDELADVLPTLASPGVYPSLSQRQAEARYYRMGKFNWGFGLYFVGMLFSIMALVTRWRWTMWTGIVLLVLGMGVHAYGLSLRWYILGRVPIANMFEAVVASAWMGIAVALLAELKYRTGVFLVAANAAGFLALVLGGYVIPGHGTITTIMGILDDVMLRIHTVCIIASYSLIFIAAVIAVIYLFGYYLVRQPAGSAFVAAEVAVVGLILLVAAQWVFIEAPTPTDPSGIIRRPGTAGLFTFAAILFALAVPILARLKLPAPELIGLGVTSVGFLVLAITTRGFVVGLAWIMILGGIAWALLTGLGVVLMRGRVPALARVVQRPATPALATAGAPAAKKDLLDEKPLLAGALPGDEGKARELPVWLQHIDWSHLIILNIVFVLLFAGTILGAVWADYSWGRPWGWDPKEVFAMNTWIVYAILIHIRYVVKNKGLWTAWLSIAGCLMMAFNWAFVNFFIVGLHSYA